MKMVKRRLTGRKEEDFAKLVKRFADALVNYWQTLDELGKIAEGSGIDCECSEFLKRLMDEIYERRILPYSTPSKQAFLAMLPLAAHLTKMDEKLE